MIKDNIYYINIKNEVYECKFNHLLGQVSGKRVMEFINNKFPINTIILDIAGIGEKSWFHHLGSDDFNPTKIYKTIENAISEVNPIFKFSCCSLLGIENIWFDTLPELENGIWEHRFDCLGIELMQPICWKWDGLRARRAVLESPKCDLLKLNSYRSLNFDFATQEYLYNPEQKCWKSEEECKKANAIKIHRF